MWSRFGKQHRFGVLHEFNPRDWWENAVHCFDPRISKCLAFLVGDSDVLSSGNFVYSLQGILCALFREFCALSSGNFVRSSGNFVCSLRGILCTLFREFCVLSSGNFVRSLWGILCAVFREFCPRGSVFFIRVVSERTNGI